MKTFIQSHWKTGLIIILSVLITVILLRSCGHGTQMSTGHHVSIDSLEQANTVTQAIAERKSNSLQGIIAKQDKDALKLINTIEELRRNHKKEIDSIPYDKDTCTNARQYVKGQQCLEEIPIIEAQLLNCENKVDNYKQLVMVKTTQNIALQTDFNRALSISRDQENDLKKTKRKVKWLKVGLVAETVVVFGAAIFVIAK
jgi:hypothetical protein